MKSEKAYNSWKDQKNQIEVGQNFTEEVMSKIYQYEQKKGKPSFDIYQLIEFISAQPLMKAGLVTAGALIGLVRLVFMIIVILSKGVING